uniref:DUF4012 domain-containing protein n=1 Tax=unclassified Mycolicibacterium TaxID=2636767 RepID=UPI0024E135E4|nr:MULTISPECIES: DUF4012 domain-containing protein [unclassified Mycolicibacterium]
MRRRPVAWAGLAVLVVVIAFACWLGFRAQAAKTNLEQARASAQQTKDALLQGNTADATRFAGDAQSHAQAARDATHSLPWNIASVVPWLGSPFKTGQQISDVVLGLAAEVLKPTAYAGATVAPSQLLADGRLDVEALRREEPALSTIAAAAARLDADAQAISDPRYLSVLGEARSRLQAQTSDIAHLLGGTALAARLAPSMMGADGPRTYFIGFQTNAEARGTGGLLGGFGILRFDDGEPSVDTLGQNTEFFDKSFTPISLDQDFDQQYGFTKPTTDIKNSNQSAHFPYAAQIWKSMWAQQSGMDVDGVIAIDPVALSYILGATGPVVMPDGETVTESNVVELTESTVYNRFPTDQSARKQYLQDVASEVVKKISGPVKSPRTLFDALGRAVSERRIAVWSSSPAEQQLLEETPLAHVIPDDPAPYAEVVINNLGGNKMDYYLDRQIEYVADGCDGDTRLSTVTVRLTNTLSDATSLSDYVAGKMGFFTGLADNIPKGAMLTSVRLLATKGAQVIGVLANDTRIRVFGAAERGHPSYEAQVAIPPGKTAVLTFRLSEPTAPGEARVPVQPLIDNVTPTVLVPTCMG